MSTESDSGLSLRAVEKTEGFRHSESLAQLAAALSKAQSQLEGAAKDSANPFFKSKYADLSSVWDACREALAENKLAVSQFPVSGEMGVGVETVLLHESGEWMAQTFYLPLTKSDPQGGGSCITYARRYALAAVVGVCPEDDDAEGASRPGRELREKMLKPLQAAAREGTRALEVVWKSMSPEGRKVCAQDLAELKSKATEADHATAAR